MVGGLLPGRSPGLSLPHTRGHSGLEWWPPWVTAGVEEGDADAGWRLQRSTGAVWGWGQGLGRR